MTNTERIILKLTSGQWILTVACAFTFSWLAVHGTLPPEATTAILGSVFTSYFNRWQRSKQDQPPAQ